MSGSPGFAKMNGFEAAGSPPDDERRDLRILNAIRQIIRAADVDSRKLAAEHDITSPQLMCLMAVVERGTTTATEISMRIHLSESTLVGVLERLEGKGLVHRVRDLADRRIVRISATEEGRRLALKTPYPLQFSLNRALRQLSARERDQIADWMERLVDLMGAREISAGPMLEIVGMSSRHGSARRRNGGRPGETD
jgi:DNA-binding MarR family transcriptional regulator